MVVVVTLRISGFYTQHTCRGRKEVKCIRNKLAISFFVHKITSKPTTTTNAKSITIAPAVQTFNIIDRPPPQQKQQRPPLLYLPTTSVHRLINQISFIFQFIYLISNAKHVRVLFV